MQIYRASALGEMVSVHRESPGLRIDGVTIGAEHLRGSRTPQEIFVNRRPVKNATILHAVTDAYGPLLPRGRYPRFVLFLDIDPARIDVNVHPTKREIRFSDTEAVHRLVRQAVKEALGDGADTVSASSGGGAALARVIGESLRVAPRWAGDASRVAEPSHSAQPRAGIATEPLFPASVGSEMSSTAPVARGAPVEVVPFGQMDRTYLIARVGDELQIIDQHTAHERVLYERLWRARQAESAQAQALLEPIPLELPAHQRALIEPHVEELGRLGLTIEPFGLDSFLLRSVPAALGTADGLALVQGLLEDMDEWRNYASMASKMHPVIATLACHSAVRAGRHMALSEISGLIEDWAAEGMMMTCPHGRRVALRLPGEELDRIFGRD